jgi:hypothetical protein
LTASTRAPRALNRSIAVGLIVNSVMIGDLSDFWACWVMA